MFVKKGVIFCGLVISSFAFATCSSSYANTVCGAGTIDNVTANRNVAMHGTKVENTTHIQGQLSAKATELNSLKAYGNVTLLATKVLGDAEIYGYLRANETFFLGSLHLYSNEAELIDVSTKDISISSHEAGVKIFIRAGSKVNGNINFIGSSGVVILGPNAEIVGSVIGGKVIGE